MGFCGGCSFSLLLLAALLYMGNAETCDYFQGRWVIDDSYPLYDEAQCPLIEPEFSCLKNDRPDHMYLKYRWQPLACNLSRFDGEDFLSKLRGSSIMFVGDSLSRNQWKSLLCMLLVAVPNAKYQISRLNDITTFAFLDYEVSVMLDGNVFLVDVVTENGSRVLKLESIQGGKLWLGKDMIIFNTWHWWNRRDSGQPWDYIELGNQWYKDMDRMVAFETALNTWVGWVDSNIDPNKTTVIFQGISPSHYHGSDWSETSSRTCKGQTTPMLGSTYPGGLPPALTVLKRALGKLEKPVTLLDITNLSQLRKDGHPSIYGLGGRTAMDCIHWCLAGVPDTWNQILYNLILLDRYYR